MSQAADAAFIEHLHRLRDSRDQGALATLRHSLTFAPGDYVRAFPLVERFVGSGRRAGDAWRLALYATAGLFAAHPVHHSRSLAAALGQLMADDPRPSLELRFLSLLEADASGVMNHLRQAIHLLAAKGLGLDHGLLLRDLCIALNEWAAPEARDRLKREWARDFYRVQATGRHDEDGALQPANA